MVVPLTNQVLFDCFPHTSQATVLKYGSYIIDVCQKLDINTPERIAAFLANIDIECEGLNVMEEDLNYSAEALQKIWPHIFLAAKVEDYARNPEKIANRVYADINGNGPVDSGDGYKYRGRGAMMITGKANYRAYSEYLSQPDIFVTNPDLLSQPRDAINSAGWFWESHKLNDLADKDFISVCKVINGGLIGYQARKKSYDQILIVLSKYSSITKDNNMANSQNSSAVSVSASGGLGAAARDSSNLGCK